MSAMRAACLLALSLFTVGTAIAADADIVRLRQLRESGRVFELRQALAKTSREEPEVRLYRAEVEGRFGQEQAAIAHLREFLATDPQDQFKRNAHEAMANALTWLGRYREAASEWKAVADLTPHEGAANEDADAGIAICETLADVPPQTVEFGDDVPLRAEFRKDSWWLPVEVNSRRETWVLDTGASFSLLSESEAKKLGLQVRDSGGRVGSGHTGKQVPYRLAVAPDLSIGRARLHNVVFIVVADRALRFGPLSMNRLSGILGLPAIRALGTLRVAGDGQVRIHDDSLSIEGDPNLFFDGLDPIVQVRHAGHDTQMRLDTGGNVSYLYPSFRDILTADELATLKRGKGISNGIGGSAQIEYDVVPRLDLELSGRAVRLNQISLRLKASAAENRFRDGLLGVDALKNGFTLDFANMRVRLD